MHENFVWTSFFSFFFSISFHFFFLLMSCSLLVRMFCDCSQIVVVLGLAIRLWLLYGSKCCSDAFVKLQSVFIASNHANAAHNRFSLYILYTIHFAIKCTHQPDTQTSSENQKHTSAHIHTTCTMMYVRVRATMKLTSSRV